MGTDNESTNMNLDLSIVQVTTANPESRVGLSMY